MEYSEREDNVLTEGIPPGKLLKIFTYPDPVLAQIASPVTQFNEELEKLTRDMLYTMYLYPGIGLAAPQIGKSIRLLVLDVDYNRQKVILPSGEEKYRLSEFKPQIFFNPQITQSRGKTTYEEGCLSLPGVYDEVERFAEITLEYQNLRGEPQVLEAKGLLSICIQHEIDHLNGVVFIDHLSQFKKSLYKKKLSKQKKSAL